MGVTDKATQRDRTTPYHVRAIPTLWKTGGEVMRKMLDWLGGRARVADTCPVCQSPTGRSIRKKGEIDGLELLLDVGKLLAGLLHDIQYPTIHLKLALDSFRHLSVDGPHSEKPDIPKERAVDILRQSVEIMEGVKVLLRVHIEMTGYSALRTSRTYIGPRPALEVLKTVREDSAPLLRGIQAEWDQVGEFGFPIVHRTYSTMFLLTVAALLHEIGRGHPPKMKLAFRREGDTLLTTIETSSQSGLPAQHDLFRRIENAGVLTSTEPSIEQEEGSLRIGWTVPIVEARNSHE
jgi:hypothetical protein